jgi:hypothetical protein
MKDGDNTFSKVVNKTSGKQYIGVEKSKAIPVTGLGGL